MKYQAFLGGFHPCEEKICLLKFIRSQGYNPLNLKMSSELDDSEQGQKNYCIIEFEENSEFKSFIIRQNFYFKGRCLHAKPFFKGKSLKKQKSKNKDLKLFLKNIPLKWDHNDLFRVLSIAVGPVEEACILTEPFSGISKGIGYVIFAIESKPQLELLKTTRKILISSQFGYLEVDSYGAGKKSFHGKKIGSLSTFKSSEQQNHNNPTTEQKQPKPYRVRSIFLYFSLLYQKLLELLIITNLM